ncbi:conserved unknown protein [Ectocarpus siliculosus]|uniref:K Homology domain-containing protein n=1 Tax=Ectocarpus siliculosus TaxID=2880 RepID=D7FM85_ECTSI|nr:conserved unknown protein [Ectocarpus siliculosus]|eukprot:CBJ29908.1 conserved unknown protein [Ectocarpus siliculosus]
MDSGDMVSQMQVAIPDHLVGVILGKGGATVIDMQNQTGARIQVSQRGEYIPGTTNRAVWVGPEVFEAKTKTIWPEMGARMTGCVVGYAPSSRQPGVTSFVIEPGVCWSRRR